MKPATVNSHFAACWPRTPAWGLKDHTQAPPKSGRRLGPCQLARADTKMAAAEQDHFFFGAPKKHGRQKAVDCLVFSLQEGGGGRGARFQLWGMILGCSSRVGRVFPRLRSDQLLSCSSRFRARVKRNTHGNVQPIEAHTPFWKTSKRIQHPVRFSWLIERNMAGNWGLRLG